MTRTKNAVIILLLFILYPGLIKPQVKVWPVLKKYDQNHLSRIAMPLGGIGTGTVSISGRGELKDWEIMNRPAKGFSGGEKGNGAPFFAIYVNDGDKKISKGLMGPLEYYEYQDKEGRPADNRGIPRFRNVTFEAAYPLAQVNLSDKNVPVKVKLKAFNPFIPGNSDDSGIPIAVLSYNITNTSSKSLSVAVAGVMRNFIGIDGFTTIRNWKNDLIPVSAKNNKNEFRAENGVKGIYMYSDGVEKENEAWGTISLSTDSKEKITYRASSTPNNWENALLDFWEEFSRNGELTEKNISSGDDPQASLAVKFSLSPSETKTINFFITWNFPNRFGWSNEKLHNYYSTQYKDAWDVIIKTHPHLNRLEEKTVEFVSAFCSSTIPDVLKEAALFNTSTLRSQAVLRTDDGYIYGWERTMDNSVSYYGNYTPVWNYDLVTPYLFGSLAKTMRAAEFKYATDSTGLMSFRIGLPLNKNGNSFKGAAADGQLGAIIKMYREWQLSGDDEFLKRLYPKVKKALEFCWQTGGWDSNRDGIMEGLQYNTMGIEYYGPNPQIQLWYLGALKSASEMAMYLNDFSFSNICNSLFENGSHWTDANLFNGEYYEQQIQVPPSEKSVAAGLAVTGKIYVDDPPYQLDRGCLVDQLAGQLIIRYCGLGDLVNPDNIVKTLNSIYKYNYLSSANDHFNNMRSFVLGDEAGLVVASFPKGRPSKPFPYSSEVMAGFEYTAALGMLFEGMTDKGLICFKNIRDRYDGLKRNPFYEAEYGHHYARALVSWGAIQAYTGFRYSGVSKLIGFRNITGSYFWSNGYSYGLISINTEGSARKCSIKVLSGKLEINNFLIAGFGIASFGETKIILPGEEISFTINQSSYAKELYFRYKNRIR